MLDQIAAMKAAFLPIENILHVGASEGQERFDYQSIGVSPCFYVEPIPNVYEILERNLRNIPGHHAIKAVCSDREGEIVQFKIASNGGQSSSFLDFGTHAKLYPAISYEAVESMVTTTIDRLVETYSPRKVPNLWVIDTQGADLHVLQGAKRSLCSVDGVFVEASLRPLYEGGCCLKELTDFLEPYGLLLHWLSLDENGNGDAFFRREKVEPEPLPTYRGNLALNKSATQSSWTEWSDNFLAARGPGGGVNGHISGYFGFHTDEEDRPWWQVDLESQHNLNEIRIYNRVDSGRERARTLQVLLSNDGQEWRCVHDQAGYTFGGKDGRPLRVFLGDEVARYVRLQLNERNFMHLDEVEIY
jgi:FkbM family methyltransferase